MTAPAKTKQCTSCGETKPICEFYPNRTKYGIYLRSRCKPCHKDKARAYAAQPIVRELKRRRDLLNYQRNREAKQAYQREYYRRKQHDHRDVEGGTNK